MKILKITIVLFFMTIVSFLFAELPYAFYPCDDNAELFHANEVVMSLDSTIFVANEYRGLLAYKFTGTEFIFKAQVNIPGHPQDICLLGDSIIFVANGTDGLRAYFYDGFSFTCRAHIDNGGEAKAIDISNDEIIYVANYDDGLRAYTYYDSVFINIGHISTSDHTVGIKVSPNGTVFRASWHAGVDAYRFNGSSFIQLSNICETLPAYDIAFLSDSTIVTANLSWMYVYHFDGSSFDKIAQDILYTACLAIKITASPNKTIFCAQQSGGLEAYSFIDSSINHIDKTESYIGLGCGVFAINDSCLLLANNYDGLRAYSFNGSTFNELAHIDNGHNINNVAFLNDTTLLVAENQLGIQVYDYSKSILQLKALHSFEEGTLFGLTSNNGIIYASNGSDGLYACKYKNSKISFLAHINDGGVAHKTAISQDSTIFLANGSDGLRAYNFQDSIFSLIAHMDIDVDSASAMDVTVGSDGKIYLANGKDGLRVLDFNGTSFTCINHINDGGSARSLAITDSVICLANGDDGLRIYDIQNDTLMLIAHASDGGDNASAKDVFVSDDIIYLANNNDGVRAYSYRNNNLTCIAHEYYKRDNYDYNSWDNDRYKIYRFNSLCVVSNNDNNVFLGCERCGLQVFDYSINVAIKDSFLSPQYFQLNQNYPNPFNPSTTINYDLPESQKIKLQVFDITGRLVETLYDGYKESGQWEHNWDASDQSSGIYIYRLQAGDQHISRKMLLIK